jgi:hypothetical protein
MSIYASLSGNSKGVDFKTSANVNEAWSKLLDFYNDCGLSPFLNHNISDFSISWREFLFYFYSELENEGINVEYDPNILPHIETHKKNLEFANELPRNPNKIDDQDSKKIVESLRKVGIKNRSLFPYQLRDLANMLQNPSSANFSVPGAGKTFVALCVNAYLKKDILVVFVPNDVVMQSWEHEINSAYDEELRPSIFRLNSNLGETEISLNELSNGGVGLITYRKILSKGFEKLFRDFFMNNPTHLILDESHRIKGGIKSSGIPSKIATKILSFSMFIDRKDILSGTPMPLNHNDLISQIEFLYPNVGLKEKIQEQQNSPGAPVRGIFVRTTKNELNLPVPVENHISQEMSKLQTAFYELVVNRYREEFLVPSNRDLLNIKIETKARLALSRVMRLSVDPYFLVEDLKNKKDEVAKYINSTKNEIILNNIIDEGKHLDMVSAKMRKVIDITEKLISENKKVIIWSQFSNSIEILEKQLLKYRAVTLYGQTENPERVVELFNDKNSGVDILIGNPKKGGEGISLHHNCHNAIYLDRTYNAAEYLQSRDRIHRIGMPSDVVPNYYLIHSVHPNTEKKVIDQRISNNLQLKIENMEKLLDDPDLKKLALDEAIGDEQISEYTLDDVDDFIGMLLND